MELVVEPARVPLRGAIRVPGDKSVSHRAVILAAMAEGTSRITGLPSSEDVRSTIEAVRALGARVEMRGELVAVTGWGADGPQPPASAIDCGNSGTTARLLAGVVAGWPVEVVFQGDASLSRRPMERVAAPLREMGADIALTDGRLPMRVKGGTLAAVRYLSPVASAQVKTLVMLAGVRAHGRTTVREPAQSRDHTERMLPAFGIGVALESDGLGASVDGPVVPHPADLKVPGDPSSAAFFAVAAALVPMSNIELRHVLLNPTRIASMEVLTRMGVPITTSSTGEAAGEHVGTVVVSSPEELNATTVLESEAPSLIDEVPILAVAATQACGTTRFEGVGELRVKESDRLQAVAESLRALGVTVRVGEDWAEIDGPAKLLGGRTLDSLGDHRLAMAFHVAGLVAGDGPLCIERYEAVDVSYPDFARDLDRMLGREAR